MEQRRNLVYLCFDPTERIYLTSGASQITKQTQCDDEATAEQIEEEATVMHNLSHPNLCQCLGWTREVNPTGGFFIYTTFEQTTCSLKDALEGRREDFEETYLWQLVGELFSVFGYLQSQGIVPPDIRLHHIRLDSFGHAKVFIPRLNAIGPSLQTGQLGTPFLSPALRFSLLMDVRDQGEVAHNPFKSAVYSLGIVLLSLTLLDIPQKLSNLIGLQHNIDLHLGKIQRRSQPWIELLAWMLRVREESRPDFLKLQEGYLYADDEWRRAEESGADKALQLSVQSGLKQVRISAEQVDEVPCLGTIKVSNSDLFIKGTDFVCVIDQSGSLMEDETMVLIQMTLIALVEQLISQDRCCLVGFSDLAKRICPLTCCTTEGKAKLTRLIKALEALDLTNIVAGFQLGLDILLQRRDQSATTCLLLFTDGESNVGEDSSVCLSALQQCQLERFTISCFSYGKLIKSEKLTALANLSGGVYSHITTLDEIQQAVGTAINCIEHYIARRLQVGLFSNPNGMSCEIVKLHFGKTSNIITFPSISQNEEINFTFLLRPECTTLSQPTQYSILQACLTYQGQEEIPCSIVASLKLDFVKWFIAPFPSRDEDVFALWYRDQGSECLLQAKERALTDQIDAFNRVMIEMEKISSGSESHQEVEKVLKDLRREQTKLQDTTKSSTFLSTPKASERIKSHKLE